MGEKAKKVIIKRIKKGHAAHHGGSWKVAYADFVTAMMAFFLLMWLLNMSSQEKRAALAMYFKDFSLFEQGGKSFMMEGGIKPSGSESSGTEVVDSSDSMGGITKDDATTKLISGIQQQGDAVKEQVLLSLTEEGVRIQIVDTPQNPIFPPGSPVVTEAGKKIIHSIASILRNFPNEIAVEGHTDGSPTRSEQISNWELSTARASAARREIELSGISPQRIARVVGLADKDLLIKERPEDPRNRRISIVFLKSAKQKPEERFDWLWKSPPGK
jgi:chemotaxis protein MotB